MGWHGMAWDGMGWDGMLLPWIKMNLKLVNLDFETKRKHIYKILCECSFAILKSNINNIHVDSMVNGGLNLPNAIRLQQFYINWPYLKQIIWWFFYRFFVVLSFFFQIILTDYDSLKYQIKILPKYLIIYDIIIVVFSVNPFIRIYLWLKSKQNRKNTILIWINNSN